MGGKKRPSKQSSIRFLWSIIIISLESTSSVMGAKRPQKDTHKLHCFFQPMLLHNFQWKLCSHILSVCSLLTYNIAWYINMVFSVGRFLLGSSLLIVHTWPKLENSRVWKKENYRKRKREIKGKRGSEMNCVTRIRIENASQKCCTIHPVYMFIRWTCWKLFTCAILHQKRN